MKKLAFALALGLAAITAAAIPAAAQTLDDIVSKGKIVIGVNLDGAPWGYTGDDGKPVGADYEAAQLLAADLGVELEVVPVTAPNRIPYLLTSKADVIFSTFSITAERAKTITFSQPYGAIQVSVFGPASVALGAPADLAGKRIAVTRGSTAEQALRRVAPADAEIVTFDDDATTTTAFASGQVELVAIADVSGMLIAKQNADRGFEKKFTIDRTFYAVGLRRGDTDFARYMDLWVFANLHNGKLGAIYQKYFGEPLAALPNF